MKEIVPGCGNCNSFTGVCQIMFENVVETPTLAKEDHIIPPGEIEGPGLPTAVGLVCTAACNASLQEGCSNFIARSAEDRLRDENI